MIFRLFLLLGLSLLFIPTSVFARVPNDPDVPQWGYTQTKVYDAWEKATGSKDVVVAIIDNGFDHLHPDLVKNAWQNTHEIPDNNIDDDKNGYIDDVWGWSFVPRDLNDDGKIDNKERRGTNMPRPQSQYITDTARTGVVHHGTVIAGIIGAAGNNKKYGAGINWHVRLMNIQLVGSTGAGGFSALPQAVRYAVDNGADVINLSIIGTGGEREIREAIDYAYEHGVSVVAAAGNTASFLNEDPHYPVCVDAGEEKPKILGVSAISEYRTIAGFSNYGSECIDITAPGVDVAGPLYYDRSDGFTDAYKDGWNGTSFAAPFVSGAAALVKSIQPTWGPDQIYEALLSTTKKTPTDDEETYTNLFGHGLLQIDRAVAYALEKVRRVKTLEGLLLVNAKDGKTRMRAFNETTYVKKKRVELTDIDFATSYVHEGKRIYATSRYNATKKRMTVRFYDDAWKQVRSWQVPAEGPLRITLADISFGSGYEVLLGSAVYDASGSLLMDYSQEVADILLAAPVRDVDTDRNNVALLYRDEDRRLAIKTMDDDAEVITAFRLNISQKAQGMIAADINGDGSDEYIIVTTGSAGQTIVRYYTWNGTRLRYFTAYAARVNGVQLTAGDMNADGSEELILLPKKKAMPLTVWDNKGRNRAEWDLRTLGLGTSALLLPLERL